MTNLLKPQLISLDDYFVDRVRTPRDADGDYDYESLYALDLEQSCRASATLIMSAARRRSTCSLSCPTSCTPILDRPCNEADALALKAEMKRLADADIPFERKQMLTQ